LNWLQMPASSEHVIDDRCPRPCSLAFLSSTVRR